MPLICRGTAHSLRNFAFFCHRNTPETESASQIITSPIPLTAKTVVPFPPYQNDPWHFLLIIIVCFVLSDFEWILLCTGSIIIKYANKYNINHCINSRQIRGEHSYLYFPSLHWCRNPQKSICFVFCWFWCCIWRFGLEVSHPRSSEFVKSIFLYSIYIMI